MGLLMMVSLPMLAATPNDSPQDLLRTLYRVHDNGAGPLLDPAASAERARFFTPELAQALDQELNRPDSDEIGALDFDPFYYAQDFEISQFDIAVPKVSGTEVTALVRFDNFGRTVEIGYRLKQDKHGWRIADIDYGDGHTLLRTLAGS
ncbi:MAG: DUF3828 domain-containing protein [Rhodanobacteraceae bacterium]|nr:DUF3828 domain-containing protein [Rhodanobacteraceae bacterium]